MTSPLRNGFGIATALASFVLGGGNSACREGCVEDCPLPHDVAVECVEAATHCSIDSAQFRECKRVDAGTPCQLPDLRRGSVLSIDVGMSGVAQRYPAADEFVFASGPSLPPGAQSLEGLRVIFDNVEATNCERSAERIFCQHPPGSVKTLLVSDPTSDLRFLTVQLREHRCADRVSPVCPR